jgi:hypothetical protein
MTPMWALFSILVEIGLMLAATIIAVVSLAFMVFIHAVPVIIRGVFALGRAIAVAVDAEQRRMRDQKEKRSGPGTRGNRR